jgi:hypothetical protein
MLREQAAVVEAASARPAPVEQVAVVMLVVVLVVMVIPTAVVAAPAPRAVIREVQVGPVLPSLVIPRPP